MDRLCKICNQNAVETEYHFVLCCNKYRHIRQKYLKRMYTSWPNVQKFNTLMSSQNQKTQYNLSKFVNEAMLKRNDTLTNLIVS